MQRHPTPSMISSSFRSVALASGLLALLSVAPGVAFAQDIFVCLSTKPSLPATVVIPAPGNGWTHSAAAPVPGTKWNRIRRPSGVDVTDPSIGTANAPGAGKTGRFVVGEKESVPLVDAGGEPTAARLSVAVNVTAFADDKPRSEPSFHSKSKQGAPVGLMDNAWRIYIEGNSLTFSVSGLVPGKSYDLYVYGATSDPQSSENPSGDGQGARFTLAIANVSGDSPASTETTGGFYSSIYTFNPESGAFALSPVGTTWAKLKAVVDSEGAIRFSTSRNSGRQQYINGFQLVEARP
jgi:hypothetical protein